ncbi:hypothetical protein FRC12_004393 [Ceratobasidium sp. 428]|nr:hypothetical protein FRC12_004393 [Ceratobasidium sp. 428]
MPPKISKSKFFRTAINRLGSRTNNSAVVPSPQSALSPATTSGQQAPTDVPTQPDNDNNIWTVLIVRLQGLRKVSSAIPVLASVVDVLIKSLEVLSDANKCRHEYLSLASRLTDIISTLEHHISKSNSAEISDCIHNLLNAIQSELALVNNKQERHTLSRFADTNQDEGDILEIYHRIESHFHQLQVNATFSMWSNMNEQSAIMHLDRLSPVMQARYNSASAMLTRRRKCTPNTRVDILGGLHTWANTTESPQIYWLNGMAGTGKTTIMYSFCMELDNTYQLGASFFCSRLLPDCQDVTRIIPTIAYQLSSFSHPFKSALCDVLAGNRDLGTYDVLTQFDKLVKQPLLAVVEAMPNNLLVVIDAIDELSGDGDVLLLLDLLFRYSADLPVRFLVSSRPEPGVREQMLSRDNQSRMILHLHDVEQALVQADIETFLVEELRTISPSETQIQQLAQQAGNLFIYASTAIRYILPDRPSVDPYERLDSILRMKVDQSSKRHRDINALYSTVLAMALEHQDLETQEADNIRTVLNTIICIHEPMNITTLASLIGLGEKKVLVALQPLWSVLHTSESTGIVSALHASFPDYMLGRERSGRFWCDKPKHSDFLAQCCFNTMSKELRFNICGLESSFVLDKDVLDFSTRVDQAISAQLFYACQHWSNHLQDAEDSSVLRSSLDRFLTHRLLFWMEVLNAKQCIGIGETLLNKTQKWLMSIGELRMRKLIEDAAKFVAYFAANDISGSTPHIYLSMLPFWPKTRPVSIHYMKNAKRILHVDEAKLQGRNSTLVATWNDRDRVRSLTVSPDCALVASGSNYGTVNVWDSRTGTILASQSECIGRAYAVAFSPDSIYVASASGYCSFHIWTARTGEVVADTFEGHDDGVSCLTFSKDGARIVSGSDEGTIIVWDSRTAMVVAGPLNRHANTVTRLVFSSDGTSFVSGSPDGEIYIWETQTYSVVHSVQHSSQIACLALSTENFCTFSGSYSGETHNWDPQTGSIDTVPFHEYDGYVCCAAFSPDCSRIATGGEYQTVCIRDVRTGRLLAKPLKGHTDELSSIAFFPDGERIVSGSDDGTICIWDIRDAATATQELSSEAHTGEIMSITFSPNGAHVASCAADGTVRVWEARTGAAAVAPMKGHDGSVLSVAFSPDGNRIASGSFDRTIRIWDMHSGSLLAGPIKTHEHAVSCVVFAPDGARMISGSYDGTIRVWDTTNWSAMPGPFIREPTAIDSLAFSNSGNLMVSGAINGSVYVWDTSTWATVATLSLHMAPSDPHPVAFLPDGLRVFSGAVGEGICVWDIRGGGAIVDLFCDDDPIEGFYPTLSPDGKRIVSCVENHNVQIWNLFEETPAAKPFEGHTRSVQALAFSPDGELVASGSYDGSIRIWDARPGSILSGENEWRLGSKGWVTATNGKDLLLWVPPEFRNDLSRPPNLAVISTKKSLVLDFNGLAKGNYWHECYADV